MSFGRPTGPPATRRQLASLLELVQAAGYDDFREARHPLGLSQRQAGGRFTGEEADKLIDQLTEIAETEAVFEALSIDRPLPRQPQPPRSASADSSSQRDAAHTRTLRRVPTELLAAELQRRGWAVVAP